jgi:hypothetical protein
MEMTMTDAGDYRIRRHSDGSTDIDFYRRRARELRSAAIREGFRWWAASIRSLMADSLSRRLSPGRRFWILRMSPSRNRCTVSGDMR